jgi:hypothetical protein
MPQQCRRWERVDTIKKENKFVFGMSCPYNPTLIQYTDPLSKKGFQVYIIWFFMYYPALYYKLSFPAVQGILNCSGNSMLL